MTKVSITDKQAKAIETFLKKQRGADLITTFLFYLEEVKNVHPVVFLREKKIYQGEKEVIKHLEEQGKLWRETEIKIQIGKPTVNAETKRVYICPFSGKVYGDNTHPNPQDAIYDWVSKCKENTERVDGLRVKRYLVSDDPDVIKNYAQERKAAISKTVFTSVVAGKLYNSKQAVIDDFVRNHLKAIDIVSVPKQNRFEIEENFLAFIQEGLEEDNISQFIEALSQYEAFGPYIEKWLEEEESEESEEEVEAS